MALRSKIDVWKKFIQERPRVFLYFSNIYMFCDCLLVILSYPKRARLPLLISIFSLSSLIQKKHESHIFSGLFYRRNSLIVGPRSDTLKVESWIPSGLVCYRDAESFFEFLFDSFFWHQFCYIVFFSCRRESIVAVHWISSEQNSRKIALFSFFVICQCFCFNNAASAVFIISYGILLMHFGKSCLSCPPKSPSHFGNYSIMIPEFQTIRAILSRSKNPPQYFSSFVVFPTYPCIQKIKLFG